MEHVCGCGMTREHGHTSCAECGGSTCRTCAIEIETTTYCRWCAALAADLPRA